MNRLILIGNGFDLAHGIKSSFKDFILNYLLNAFNFFFSDFEYKDELLEIRWHDYNKANRHRGANLDYTDIQDFNRLINENKNLYVIFHSELLKRTFETLTDLNWVDIEMEFFKTLVRAKNFGVESVEEVNTQMDYMKYKLKEYLTTQEQEHIDKHYEMALVDCFMEPIKVYDIVTEILDEDIEPDILYFLNFNYTNTIDKYVDIISESAKVDYNYIHGSLDGRYGDIIFGFGDEYDKSYLEFEESEIKDLFKHIKSFSYLKTQNFYKLTRFIESGNYQVHIYGHSCGLSDRTMLKEIFENDYCKSVKIFYHSSDGRSNNFINKTYEISRHFSDKSMFRKKLVPLELCREMPQLSELSPSGA